MPGAGPPRAEATLTESTRNLVLGAVVTALLAVSVIAETGAESLLAPAALLLAAGLALRRRPPNSRQ